MSRIDEISSLSEHDYFSIVTTYNSMTNNVINCFHCKKINNSEVGMNRRRDKGCWDIGYQKHFYKPKHSMEGSPSIFYDKCPGNFFSHYWARIINYHQNWEKGLLPYPGTYLEQPAKFVEAMTLVDNLKAEALEQKNEELNKYGVKHR